MLRADNKSPTETVFRCVIPMVDCQTPCQKVSEKVPVITQTSNRPQEENSNAAECSKQCKGLSSMILAFGAAEYVLETGTSRRLHATPIIKDSRWIVELSFILTPTKWT